MSPPLTSAEHYNRDVAGRGVLYSDAAFEDVHRSLVRFLPTTGAKVLDVGAGTGRDADALTALGYEVTAVEPSASLRSWAREHQSSCSVQWLDDRLPDLPKVRALSGRYAFILCSAVLMHVPPRQLRRTFATFRALLAPRGVVAVSVRRRRLGDPPELFHDLTDAMLLGGSAAAGLKLIQAEESSDVLGRTDVKWRSFVFE